MHCLVTGGTGFIGTRLVALLVEQGWTVRVLSRAPCPLKKPCAIKWIQCDLSSTGDLLYALTDVEVVFHLAGIVPGVGDAKAMWDTNVRGTERLLSACREARVRRLVLASSVSVYTAPLAEIVDE